MLSPHLLQEGCLLLARDAPRGPEVDDDGLSAKLRQAELSLAIEPLEREVGRRRQVTASRGTSEAAAFVFDELPEEKREEQDDEPDGHALGHEQQPPTHAATWRG